MWFEGLCQSISFWATKPLAEEKSWSYDFDRDWRRNLLFELIILDFQVNTNLLALPYLELEDKEKGNWTVVLKTAVCF